MFEQGWTVILLGESATLTGSGYATWCTTHDASTPHLLRLLRRRFYPRPGLRHRTEYGLGFGFPAADLSDVLTLLDSVRRQRLYQDYTAQEGSDTGAWSPPHIRHDQIRIYGPVIATGSREPWAPAASVELEYATLADLHSNLRTLADFAQHGSPAPHKGQRSTTRICPDKGRLAKERYVAARLAFETTVSESRRLLELGARRRSRTHDRPVFADRAPLPSEGPLFGLPPRGGPPPTRANEPVSS
jgi:hypothetical protein